jgi:hypothetical protein
MKYAQEPLQIKTGCGTSALIDLDAPRADPPQQQGDLRYNNICSADGPLLGLGAGAQAAAVVADADTDAPGCDDAIRTGPLGKGDNVPVQKGTVLCVRTGTPSAPVLALVEVTALAAKGRATIRATAWSAAPKPSEQAPSEQAPSGPAPSDDARDPGDAVPSDEASGEVTPGE